ncbi:MAG: diguanylate cyclase [Treponema sp.]|nr:diguanylate cyclase [Treponema sp.]
MNENTSKQCILIIDDDPIQLKALGHILFSLYDVRTAKDGEAGLRQAAKYNVDLILLDLVMQDMSGFEVLARLKASTNTRNIPVIFITGSISNEDEAKCLALGAVDYIRKPFTEVVVSLRVKIHLQLIAQMKAIENLSLTDGLTGISNRRGFDQMIKSSWAHAKRANESLSVLMLDIDKFKQFNDKHGHLNGDTCLKIVAGTIQATLERGSDHVYRWGGEEFAIILPCTPIDGAMLIAERVRENVASAPMQLGSGETVHVTISIGAGSIAPAHMDSDKLLVDFFANLDKALYRAKENGRNRVEMI